MIWGEQLFLPGSLNAFPAGRGKEGYVMISVKSCFWFSLGWKVVTTASVIRALGTDCFHREETVQEWR